MTPMFRAASACLLLLAAAAASAQEYGRSTGGELSMVTKQPSKLSATLGFRMGSGKGFEGAVGGTVIEDRMWFFASALREDNRLISTVPTAASSPRLLDSKLNTQLTPSQSLTGSYDQTVLEVPQSFLNLHYTGILSSNSFFSVNLSSTR